MGEEVDEGLWKAREMTEHRKEKITEPVTLSLPIPSPSFPVTFNRLLIELSGVGNRGRSIAWKRKRKVIVLSVLCPVATSLTHLVPPSIARPPIVRMLGSVCKILTGYKL